jgi:HPt (histidine-containing phosphotransfer) domain-containing protein
MAIENNFTTSNVHANHMNNDNSPSPVNQPSTLEGENPPPINRTIFQEWQELGGPEFVARMAEQFVMDVTTCVHAIEHALDHDDNHGIAEAAHGLKGICANIGATQLHRMAITIEQANREGKALDGPQTMEKLQNALTQIQAFLATELSILSPKK